MSDDRILDMLCAMRPTASRESLERFMRGDLVNTSYLTVSADEFRCIETHARSVAIWEAEQACDLTAPAEKGKFSQGWIACRERSRKAILSLIRKNGDKECQ